MVRQAMIVRWTAYKAQLSCFAVFVLVLGIHARCSLNSEGLALLQFRVKLEFDPSGVLANWDPNDCDPCMWSGVHCVEGKVHVIDLNGHDLEGVLAPEIGNLSHLRVLYHYWSWYHYWSCYHHWSCYSDLSKNHLSGTIPQELGQLTTLEVLDLSDNKLTGIIPAELGRLHSLKRLLLCNNVFEGSLPVEIEKLSLLTDLQCDTNTVVAEAGCVNRKFGHCRHLPESVDVWNINNQVTNVRRILFEQSSNLAAFPPGPARFEPVIVLPSRSSGSFSAIPHGKKLSPAPLLSPISRQEPKNVDPANSGQPTPVKSGNSLSLIVGLSVAVFLVVVAGAMCIVCRSRAVKTIGPWKTGLSGQLQKAFVTGVPKLNRDELETACEDFSNIITTDDHVATMYKGTLSSGVEIAVTSTAIISIKDWSKRSELVFRKKIATLSRVNHKNFLNLIGYCEDDQPFSRMMVFEYAPNSTLFEHLHVKEVEHIDWNARTRIIMGTAYCLQHMHDLNPPIAHPNLNSKEILLTDDYAAKIGDIGFWAEFVAEKKPAENELKHCELPPLADVETNVHSFGVLLLEIISGRLLSSDEQGQLLNSAKCPGSFCYYHMFGCATQYLNDKKMITSLIDPTLKSFKENELDVVCEVMLRCVHQDAHRRPSMREVIQTLRQAIDISPESATPRLSPLWWAELEILSSEAL
ncbi:hypothetical protein CASFOL_040794 [Castilleja foliolosa]|uniref:Protein kinase domain-containing protein n=1 Tax=Castilleja foliolosa TaxID=1961234 RepID=A0ABD3BCN0_9LAMI